MKNINRHFYYTFRYLNGDIKISGGNDGLMICGNIDHENTKVDDIVDIEQFNRSGSFPSKAEIIGKLTFDWDMSKPYGQRKSNEKIEGVGYNNNKIR